MPLFELVSRGVRQRQVLKFQYRKPGEKRAEARRVHPYHLLQFDHRWYLLAHDLARKALRTFVLGRMREAVLLDEHFQKPKDFDPRQVLGGSLGVMSGRGDYQVVIEMDAWLTDVLRGRRWHPSQEVAELPGGGSQVRMRLSGLEENRAACAELGRPCQCGWAAGAEGAVGQGGEGVGGAVRGRWHGKSEVRNPKSEVNREGTGNVEREA